MIGNLLRSLVRKPSAEALPDPSEAALLELARTLGERAHNRLGRSLALRTLPLGSCGGCNQEIEAVAGPLHDIEAYGFQFVASPRQADVLLVPGLVTAPLVGTLRRARQAMAAPSWVVAIGDCAADGGLFAAAIEGGAKGIRPVATEVPVDLHIRGCPPSPTRLLEGLIALMEVSAVDPA